MKASENWLVVVGGCIVLNAPFLEIFDALPTVGGMPARLPAILDLWGAMVALLRCLALRVANTDKAHSESAKS